MAAVDETRRKIDLRLLHRSVKRRFYEAKDRMLDDFMWLDNLPTQLVLDHIRLVHAGYDPRMPIDMQGEKELLWIRKEWFEHEGTVDPSRTVFLDTRPPPNSAMPLARSLFHRTDSRWTPCLGGA